MTVQELYDKLGEHIKNGGAQDTIIVTDDIELTSRDCNIYEVSYVFAGTVTLRHWRFKNDNNDPTDDDLIEEIIPDQKVFILY